MNSGCVGVLPVAQFSNGFTFTVARLHEQWGVRPFSFHATYASDKVLKLREEGAWLNEPSRVNSLRVLYYDPKIPREMFPIPTGGGPEGACRVRYTTGRQNPLICTHPSSETLVTIKSARHFSVATPLTVPLRTFRPASSAEKYLGQVTPWHHAALLQYQLRQLHAALAIAHVLQRTIVLPRFACLCGASPCPCSLNRVLIQRSVGQMRRRGEERREQMREGSATACRLAGLASLHAWLLFCLKRLF